MTPDPPGQGGGPAGPGDETHGYFRQLHPGIPVGDHPPGGGGKFDAGADAGAVKVGGDPITDRLQQTSGAPGGPDEV